MTGTPAGGDDGAMQPLPAIPPPGTTRIVLHGRLRRKFGGPVDWGCATPAHAIYALMAMKPGFKQELEKGAYRVVRGPLEGGLDMDENLLKVRFGAAREFHIIPTAMGRGGNSGGIAKIILGVVLVVAAAFTAGGALIGVAGIGATAGTAGGIAGALGLGNTLFGVTAGALGLFGSSLILGGVGSILSAQPKTPLPNASFILNGPTNTTAQGGPVPLCYGFKVRVGSVLIASSYEAQQMQVNNSKGANQGGQGNPF